MAAGDLENKVAIITGGSAGIGRATAELFVREKARVVIADLDDANGMALAEKLGASALYCHTDVSDGDAVQKAVDLAVSRFGRLDIMFNNAGINTTGANRFLDNDLADFDRIMHVNLLGVLHGCQRAARVMAKYGGGSIINTASMAGILAGFGLITYRAAKAAVAHISKSLAIDLAEYNIRVNCITPGNIETQMTSAPLDHLSADEAARVKEALDMAWFGMQSLKRKGQPEDIAQAALYLASDRSAHVTGIVLPVDGGGAAGDQIDRISAIMNAYASVVL